MGKTRKRRHRSSSSESEHGRVSKRALLRRIEELENRVPKQSGSRSPLHVPERHSRPCSRESRARSYARSHSRSPSRYARSRSHSRVRYLNDTADVENSPSAVSVRGANRPTAGFSGGSNLGQDGGDGSGNEHSPVLSLQNDVELGEDVVQILGTDPAATPHTQFSLHTAVARRWQHTFSEGLTGEIKTSLIKKYGTPNNCPFLKAPLINDGVKAAMSAAVLKRDEYQSVIQTQIGQGLTALGAAINFALEGRYAQETLFEPLCDAAKLITDAFHLISMNRRGLLNPLLSKKVADLAIATKPTEYLYGDNFEEIVQKAKAIEKAGKDLKAPLRQPIRRSVPAASTSKTEPPVKQDHGAVVSKNSNRRGRPMRAVASAGNYSRGRGYQPRNHQRR